MINILKNKTKNNPNEIIKYTKIDSILSIITFIIIALANLVMGKIIILNKHLFYSELSIFIITGIYSLLIITIVLMLCLYRKQNLSTIGISKKNIGMSLVIGFVLSIIIIIDKKVISTISLSTVSNNLALIVMKIIHYLIFISLTEEIVFRGYIGSRISQNKKLSTLITGILFSIAHIPFQLAIYQINLLEYINSAGLQLLLIILAHYILQWLYSKYNNFAGPTLIHFVLDFTGWLIKLDK